MNNLNNLNNLDINSNNNRNVKNEIVLTNNDNNNENNKVNHNPICRYCDKQFNRNENNSKACRYHPESYTGETAQRWSAPGDNKNGGKVYYFWSCCGSELINAPGCCYSSHIAYGESVSIELRRPGQGIENEENNEG